jgi:hypothetical protein
MNCRFDGISMPSDFLKYISLRNEQISLVDKTSRMSPAALAVFRSLRAREAAPSRDRKAAHRCGLQCHRGRAGCPTPVTLASAPSPINAANGPSNWSSKAPPDPCNNATPGATEQGQWRERRPNPKIMGPRRYGGHHHDHHASGDGTSRLTFCRPLTPASPRMTTPASSANSSAPPATIKLMSVLRIRRGVSMPPNPSQTRRRRCPGRAQRSSAPSHPTPMTQ